MEETTTTTTTTTTELPYDCDFKFEIAEGANVTVVLENAGSTSIVFELMFNDPRCSFKEEVELMVKTVGYTAKNGVDFKCKTILSF